MLRGSDVILDADVVIGGSEVSAVFEDAGNSDAVGDGVDDNVSRALVVIVDAIEDDDVIEEEETKREEEDEEGTNVV